MALDMAAPASRLQSIATSRGCLALAGISGREVSFNRSLHPAGLCKGIASISALSSPPRAVQWRRQFPQGSPLLPRRRNRQSGNWRPGSVATSALQSKECEDAFSEICTDICKEEDRGNAFIADSVSFVVFVAAGALLSYGCYPTLLQLARGSEPLTDDLRAYVGQVSGITSLMFAILLGNTYSFIQGRLKGLLQATMTEVLALQRLMDEAMLESEAMPVWSRTMLSYIQLYFVEEIPTASLQKSTITVCADSVAIQGIMSLVLEHSKSDIAAKQPLNLLSSAQYLGQCRCARLSASESILPSLHWIILITLAVINALAFPLLDPDSVVGSHSMQRCLFSVVITTVSVTLFVMVDFAYPLDGLYGISSMPYLASITSSVWRRLQENRKILDWASENNK